MHVKYAMLCACNPIIRALTLILCVNEAQKENEMFIYLLLYGLLRSSAMIYCEEVGVDIF
jgi:hypothetical protein